jgi:ketosteroid isomerase-like protein
VPDLTAEDAVGLLLDREAILDCVTMYCRAIDRREEELLPHAYHAAATVDHLTARGQFAGSASGFVAWAWTTQGARWTEHYLTSHTASIDGDTAYAETQFFLVGRSQGDRRSNLGGGRYIDRFEHRDGDWRIAHRDAVGHWTAEVDDLASDYVASRPPRRDRDDPSYERLPARAHVRDGLAVPGPSRGLQGLLDKQAILDCVTGAGQVGVSEWDQCHVTTHNASVDGDRADAETYFLVTRPATDGRLHLRGGRYLDRLERASDDWRIATRTVVDEWNVTVDHDGPPPNRPPTTRDAPTPGGLPLGGGRTGSGGLEDDVVRHLLDRQAILDCVHRNSRGVHQVDRDLVLSTYHEDAIHDHQVQGSEFVGSPAGFMEQVEAAAVASGAVSLPHLANHVVTIEGDVAYAETYWFGTDTLAAAGIRRLEGGRYIDCLERREGEWRLLTRLVTGEWRTLQASQAER